MTLISNCKFCFALLYINVYSTLNCGERAIYSKIFLFFFADLKSCCISVPENQFGATRHNLCKHSSALAASNCAVLVPARPLNNAQMCGSFYFITVLIQKTMPNRISYNKPYKVSKWNFRNVSKFAYLYNLFYLCYRINHCDFIFIS